MTHSTHMQLEQCLDGCTLVMGPLLLTPNTKDALAAALALDLDCDQRLLNAMFFIGAHFEVLDNEERETFYAVLSNLYSVYIPSPTRYMEALRSNGVEIELDGRTYLPVNRESGSLAYAFIKAQNNHGFSLR